MTLLKSMPDQCAFLKVNYNLKMEVMKLKNTKNKINNAKVYKTSWKYTAQINLYTLKTTTP